MKSFNPSALLLTALIFLSSTVLALPAPEPAPQPAPPAQTDSTFINTVLTRVNNDRALHKAAALTWDANLATYARKYANNCNGAHSNGPYGENTYYFYTSDPNPNFVTNTQAAIDFWYNEYKVYNVNNPAPAYHYTQLVWKSSKRIGCAWSASKCPDTHYYLFCEFDPMGNIAGQFAANVS